MPANFPNVPKRFSLSCGVLFRKERAGSSTSPSVLQYFLGSTRVLP
ncbi:MAG: hypothetical protein HP007_05045 [Bacteroides sp.]|nr:hypothetical protein [Bacteroides sp.]